MSKIKSLLNFLPAALWYGLIWRMSAQTATASGQSSGSLMGKLFSAVVTDYRSAAPLTQQAVQELASFYIRKAAHMFLFFVLAILLWYGFAALIQKRPLRALCTTLSCAVLAALDEFHQTFVPGRSGEVRDVLVDLSGSLIALLLFALPVIGLWLQKTVRHPERVWLLGALCGTAALIYVGLLTEPAPFFVSRAPLSPLFMELTAAENAALLEASAPSLRQILYIFVCAVTAFLSVCLATLSGNPRAIVLSFISAIFLTAVSGMIWALPPVMGIVLCLGGGGVAVALRKCFPLLSK